MSSTSKMSVLNGLICPMSRSPYAISCGMKSCHLLPTGIMVSASVQPFITWSARKVAGLPPCFSVESNTVPSMSRPSYFTFTRLDFCGTSPLPFTSTLSRQGRFLPQCGWHHIVCLPLPSCCRPCAPGYTPERQPCQRKWYLP